MTDFRDHRLHAKYPDSLERQTWCLDCGAFLAKHVYKLTEGDFHLFVRCELAAGLVLVEDGKVPRTRQSGYSGKPPPQYAKPAARRGRGARHGIGIVFAAPAVGEITVHCPRCGALRSVYTGHR